MNAELLKKFSSHYIIVMMLVTRLIGSIGGTLTIYYVSITLRLPSAVAFHFYVAAGIVVVLAVVSTTIVGLWETRSLRGALGKLERGSVLDLPLALAAGREAVRFCGLHHLHEAFLVPLVTTLPVCVF